MMCGQRVASIFALGGAAAVIYLAVGGHTSSAALNYAFQGRGLTAGQNQPKFLASPRRDFYFDEFTLRDYLTAVLAFVVSALANAAGVGGGAFFVPLFQVVLGLTIKEATVLSQAAIAGGALSGSLFSLFRGHPDDARALLDFRMALVLMPVLLLGTSVGVMLNRTFPDWTLTLLLTLLLVFLTSRVLQRGLRLYCAESADRGKAGGPAAEEPPTDPPACNGAAGERAGSAAALAAVWAAFAGAQAAKSLVERCSLAFAGLFLAQAAVCVGFTAAVIWRTCAGAASGAARDEERPLLGGAAPGDPAHAGSPGRARGAGPLVHCAAVTLIGGMAAGLVGLGGGMILGPLLLELGTHPVSAAATSGLLVLGSSGSAVLEFGLDRRVDVWCAGFYAALCAAASLTGTLVVGRAVRASGRASIVAFILAAVLGGGGLLTAASGVARVIEMVHSGNVDGLLSASDSAARAKVLRCQRWPTTPGEDAPGTGRRRFPEEVLCTREMPCPEERAGPFEMKTTEQAYREFPAAVRSSYPLYVRTAGPQEPLGELEKRAEGGGPDTRARRRPAFVDHMGAARPRLHHAETPEALQQEVAQRKGGC
ncbi:hypothetical protein WJX81_001511 [Elliptochloris bilobata]|uniref:Sulfite exporter TauE/SafE family protein n=1 Tax=Elliptochloris bilobata TaxID=381761 RepID=A0AAW1SJ79_9CHLO